MSKGKKAFPPKPSAAPRPAVEKAETPAKNWFAPSEPAATETEFDGLLRKIFMGIAAVSLVTMLALSLGSGINADDKFQNDYCGKLLNYYGSFGKDTTALFVKDGNMHLYGGFFEVVTGGVNKALGYHQTDLAYHNVRHMASALMGWLAMLCAALLTQMLVGWRGGIITFLLLFLSPRFFGDSLMNPKDIPFACGYMLAIYNMAVVLRDMPSPRRKNLIGLAAGLAIALSMRAGGLLAFAMLFLFGGLHWMFGGWRKEGSEQFSAGKIFQKYALVVLGTAAVGYAVAVLFWPYALQSPLKNPLNALSQFSALEVKIRVLFEGNNIMSDKTPWYYAPKWIWLTVPLSVLVGFVGSLVFVPRFFKKYDRLGVLLVLFAAIFPVFYVVYKHSVLHDGWRHLTFAYPPLAVAAGLFWNELVDLFSGKKFAQYAVYVAVTLGMVDAAAFIFANPKMPYTYFNPIQGGTKGAVGNYETDYWGISVRQGLEYLESQGILKPDMPEKVVIATNMFYSAKQLCAKYGDKVVVKYIKWDRRCDDAWDYALYPTRFIDGSTLRKGFWPPDNCIHLISAGGAPILAVLKDNGKNCALGTAASKLGDWQTAIARFKAEAQNVPDNDLAWVGLATAYLNAGNLDSAAICAHKSLEINPDDSQANNTVALILMRRNDFAGAKQQFEKALKLEPSNAGAAYYLGLLAQNSGDNQQAMNWVMRAIDIAPNFRPAYELGLAISQAMGNDGQAQRFQAALSQLK